MATRLACSNGIYLRHRAVTMVRLWTLYWGLVPLIPSIIPHSLSSEMEVKRTLPLETGKSCPIEIPERNGNRKHNLDPHNALCERRIHFSFSYTFFFKDLNKALRPEVAQQDTHMHTCTHTHMHTCTHTWSF